MEENNFERQVQQEMDDLRIHPSDAVWENVKIRIERKKDRRRGIILFFILAALLLSGSYFIFNSGQNVKTSETAAVDDIKEKENKLSVRQKNGETVKELSKIRGLQTDDLTSLKKTKDLSIGKIDVQNNINTTRYIIKQPAVKHTASNITSNKNKSNAPHDNDINPPSVTTPETTLQQDLLLKNKKVIKPDINVSLTDSTVSNETNDIVATLNPDTLSKTDLVQNVPEVQDAVNVKLNNKAPTPSSLKNKWHFGGMLSGGISDAGNNFWGSDYKASADYISNPSTNQGNSNNNIAPPPSQVQSSGGYKLGVFVQKNLSQRLTLAVGANLQSFNVSNLVGTIGITERYLTSRNPSKKYRNNFYFIELPVDLKIQIGKGKKMPVYWQGGISLSGLISSNALQYKMDSTAIYYKDNSLLNKTQFGLSTGLSATILKINKNPLVLGPYIYYSTSGMAKQGLYAKQHFVYFGLRSEIVFYKK